MTETEKRGLSALAPLAGVSLSGLTPGGGKTGRPIALLIQNWEKFTPHHPRRTLM